RRYLAVPGGEAMLRRRFVSAIIIGIACTVLSAVLASCGLNRAAAPPPADVVSSGSDQKSGPAQGQESTDKSASPWSGSYAAQPDRLVIKNATLQIVVNNPQDTLATIGKMAEDMGGWVVTSSAYQTKARSGVTI